MKKYYAIKEIGGYKPEEEVPTDKAELWLKMYLTIPPVRVVEVPDLFPKELDVNTDGRVDVADRVEAERTVSKVKSFLKRRK